MLKKLLSFLLFFSLVFIPVSGIAKGYRSYSSKSSSKAYKVPTYKPSSYKIPSYNSKSSYKSYGTSGYKSNTYKIPSYKPFKTPTYKTYNYNTKSTFKSFDSSLYKTNTSKIPYRNNDVTYGVKSDFSQTYKSTGLPKVNRSEAARRLFLIRQGYYKVPDGYEVDHIIPLFKGGADAPENMQLLTIEQHKQKTASER